MAGPIERTPGADGGTFYAGSGDGKLYALNATDGSTLWTFDTGDPDVGTPSIANGMVYLTHHAGKSFRCSMPPPVKSSRASTHLRRKLG